MPRSYFCKVSELQPSDELSTFAKWFLSERPLWHTPVNGISEHESIRGAVLYRDADKQVQIFIAGPNTYIPDHVHPNVDSYEVSMWGVEFRCNGRTLLPMSQIDGANGIAMRVRPHCLHGGTISPVGGCFLSIQHWLNGVEPSSVANDWQGTPLGPDHAIQLKH